MKRVRAPMLKLRQEKDLPFENALRPTTLDEYVGQVRAKKVLSTALRAARARGEAVDHVLLHGNPGFGKTTFRKQKFSSTT